MEEKNELLFLIAYLSLADLQRIFWEISSLFGVNGFFNNNRNKSDLFSFNGKYLEGFLFESEY